MMKVHSPVALQRIADAGTEVSGDAKAPAAPADPSAERAERRLAMMRQRFDLANERRAELMREHDAMRDLLMAMLKSEDMYMKKWIEMI
jgi:hypothetical protein